LSDGAQQLACSVALQHWAVWIGSGAWALGWAVDAVGLGWVFVRIGGLRSE